MSSEIKSPFARQDEFADKKSSLGNNNVSSVDNSNFEENNGKISVEVVENNAYRIEIPWCRTMVQGGVYSMNENIFYFPYSSGTIDKPWEFSIDRTKEKSKSKTSNSASQNNRKNKLSNSNTAKAAPSY